MSGMQPIQTLNLDNGLVLKVFPECEPEDPRTWDNLGVMVCWHRTYKLGDRQIRGKEAYDELLRFLNRKDVISLPLYLYDHSGLTMNTKGFASRWDSGQVGYIYVEHDVVRKEFGHLRVSKRLKARVIQVLKQEVKTYDQYLRGDIYGFVLSKTVTCSEGEEHEKVMDSCWGFYGDDITENGMLECFEEEEQQLVLRELKGKHD